MSLDAVAKFVDAINGSAELQKECRQALEGSTDPAPFVAFAHRNGFDVTAEEVWTCFHNAPSSVEAAELSDEELAMVSGGMEGTAERATKRATTALFNTVGKPLWASHPGSLFPILMP
jgi:predicted ribosomally synthesized peptide with nif11-like leader